MNCHCPGRVRTFATRVACSAASSSGNGGTGASNAPKIVFLKGNAGKGAVHNYGQRKGRQARSDGKRIAPVFPQRPPPEATTFSLPSSSFNASSYTSPGVAPPLAGQKKNERTGRQFVRKKTALLMPGQGSQYVTMSRDLYNNFQSARDVWHKADACLNMFAQGKAPENATKDPMREQFEQEMARSAELEALVYPRGMKLTELVFNGDQLELTRSENAQPAVFACTMAFLNVLRKEFEFEMFNDHIDWLAGHGSGTYAALVAANVLDADDAFRALRFRGLEAMRCLREHPVLFPKGCTPPAVIYETWAFANASSSNLLAHVKEEPPPEGSQSDVRKWKHTQVNAVSVRPGCLDQAIAEVVAVQGQILRGEIPDMATDEFVGISNINSQQQIVLSGTRTAVVYTCSHLRIKGLGARAVNLPVSGPYHTALVGAAQESFGRVVDVMPIREPDCVREIVSSVDGSVLRTASDVRYDLGHALSTPVRWLDTINTLIDQGVRRFVCLGPGRALAHLLSKELAYRERHLRGNESLDTDFEVWSIATANDVHLLVNSLRRLLSQ
ncbi:[acyl-carrier-protein] S-malonyltransferase [Malassezia cuniculi]|uniref:[acyl-carrier-protein] S-malonyltransferase n=1 Tax=Malassezia cuniculi TaxID=948313 RepID=A0AAF0EYY6_9BASI|nr:[acyl-carrier-protein] S-malonyltransferase [Malassezia cuniculi]